MRKKFLLITAIAVFLSLTATVMAAGLDSFFPNKSSNLKRLYGGIFLGKADGKINDTTDTEIIPHYSTFRYAIKQTSKGGYAKVLKGKKYSESTAKKFMKIFDQKADVSNYYWFKSKEALPKVAYTGYHIFDNDLGQYVDLYMVAEVTKVGKSYNQHPKWKSEGKPYTIALSNASNSKFRGLPSLIIIGHGNVEIRITYYRAGNTDKAPSQWTNTGNEYTVKSNITYRDIDAGQAISIKEASANGFTGPGPKSRKPNINFGKYDGFYSAQARNLKGVDKDNKNYWLSYNLNRKSIVMRYTTNQIDYTKSTDKKKVEGKPSGAWTYLGTQSYDTIPTFSLPAPVKKVYDDNKNDDIDKTNNTHNFINSSKKSFYYTVTQNIPAGLDYTTKYALSNLTFTDKLDSCLSLDPADKVKIYKNSISSGNDITKYFTNNSSGKTISYKSIEDGKKIINLDGKGGKIIIKIPVKVSVSDDVLEAHTSNSLRSGNTVHKQGNNAYLDIPNEAKVRSKNRNGDVYIKYTNPVQTRIPTTPKHDIVIQKTVATAPSGENIDKSKRFNFVITLNNGTAFNGTIIRANGKKESITLKKTGTFSLAHGDKLTITKVPQSTTYTIKEVGNERYTPSFHLDSGSDCLTQKVINSPAAGEGDNLSVTDTITKVANYNPIKYTFTNTKTIKYHDLSITKKIESDEKTRDFPFILTLSGLVNNKPYETSIGNKTADADGKLTLEFDLSNDQTFYINNLPDEAKYKIVEKGAEKYKARFEVTEGADKVNAKNGSGDISKGVYTPTETLNPAETDYDISYNVYNDNRNLNDFVIGKEIEGSMMNENDEFTFEVSFSNLPKNSNQKYKSIEIEVYEWNGEKKIIKTYPAEEIDNASYTVQLKLKADQFAAFTNILDGTSYHITEKGNDYVASFEGRGKDMITNESLDDVSGSNEEAYKDLSVSRTIPENMCSKYDYMFTNVREKEPVYNNLKTSKIVTNASSEEFDITANLHGLEKNHAYALYTEKGDTEYELITEENAIRVRTGKGTIGSQYDYIGGIPLEITRADGETKVIYTSGDITDNNLEPIKGWIDYKGGDYTVKWIGGIWKEDPMGYYEEPYKGTLSGKAVKNVPVNLYKVADIFENTYDIAPEFSSIRDDIETMLSSGNYAELSELIGQYVNQTSMQPLKSTTTDKRNNFSFTDLDFALYYVKTENYTDDDTAYTGTGTLVSVPGSRKDNNTNVDDFEILDLDNKSVFVGTISEFASDGNGNATLNYQISDEMTYGIDGLPEGSSYNITEKANDYKPSYEIKRNNTHTDYKEGTKNTDLTTRKRSFESETPIKDQVIFTNSKSTHMLKTKKHTSDNSSTEFDFSATVSGLKDESYTAMVPGEGDFHVSMDENGNLKLTAENYNKSIEGIPFKLIRPYDNAERICYTDSNGEISSDEFISWLSKGQKGSYSFLIEWNGGQIKGHFSP